MLRHQPMSVKVDYFYSACIKITSVDLSILCDPWFTDGIYDGSWFKEIEIINPIQSIGNVDFIFISHIHPDHYDPSFLSAYMEVYGPKQILIASRPYNYLEKRLLEDGFSPVVVDSSQPFSKHSSRIHIFPIMPDSPSSIDSIMVFDYFDGNRRHIVINTNDSNYEDINIDELKLLFPNPDILLCGHTGAGPYPQTYFDPSDPNLVLAALEKKQEFLRRYICLTKAISASINIPFAGQYLLGGRLSHLNKYRGISDPTELLKLDPNAVVLMEMVGSIDTYLRSPINPRTQPFNPLTISNRINDIQSFSFPYSNLFNGFTPSLKQLRPLLRASYASALRRSTVNNDYFLAIAIHDSYFVMNLRHGSDYSTFVDSLEQVQCPRSIYTLDLCYLFGLLTHIYHWNNAEIGSHISVSRSPNLFSRPVQEFLNFFHV